MLYFNKCKEQAYNFWIASTYIKKYINATKSFSMIKLPIFFHKKFKLIILKDIINVVGTIWQDVTLQYNLHLKYTTGTYFCIMATREILIQLHFSNLIM